MSCLLLDIISPGTPSKEPHNPDENVAEETDTNSANPLESDSDPYAGVQEDFIPLGDLQVDEEEEGEENWLPCKSMYRITFLYTLQTQHVSGRTQHFHFVV